jgi:hypothetical protein
MTYTGTSSKVAVTPTWVALLARIGGPGCVVPPQAPELISFPAGLGAGLMWDWSRNSVQILCRCGRPENSQASHQSDQKN